MGKIELYFLGIVFSLVGFAYPVQGQVMTSTNYRVFSDAVSVGGALGTSTNYHLFDSVGEPGSSPVTSTSASFAAHLGFLTTGAQIISMTASANSISLGTLALASIQTGSVSFLVTTNSISGFSTSIRSDGNLRSGANTIDSVGDGAVTAGSEEYGIRTQGSYGSYNASDAAISSASGGTVFAQSTVPVTNAATTLIFRAAISNSVVPGDYAQSVTITTSANF